MQLSNEAKDVENRNLQALLNEKQESDFDEGISDDALRKRLNRLCERKKNGHLQVPQELHDMWLKGGDERKLLLQRLQEAGLDKDKFISTVCLEIKQKEGVKVRSRIKGVKEYCEANRAELIGWDKYENKPKYWYEEDLEMEWEKQKERSASTTTKMEMQRTGENVANDMTTPMQMDMQLAARGMGEPGKAPVPMTTGSRGGDSLLPCVPRNAVPSSVVTKYMDGLAKRINKDLGQKYGDIDPIVAKVGKLTKDLEAVLSKMTDVYSEGAVEGYSAETQDSVTLEVRTKSIPIPKSSAVKPKAKAKGTPKVAPKPAAKPEAASAKPGKRGKK
ncbi:unnamed protein product [Symbiodinium pilosum]|uniref:Uncharacterized protein n=1 Tax=Symbiodinium pilosum TaxID=2952 RepID=A0A812XYN2_SYMPI|nr:unnamed protein product [Symbiodinium pilosum]